MTGKIYVFGIGGTGARVIKSLTMLAGAGVPMEVEAIVPIIIDPDFGNADVTRAIKQLNIYANIRELLVFNDTSKNGFFQISIEKAVNDYRLRLKDTKSKKFKEYIDLGNLSRANRALASILFSETNLDIDDVTFWEEQQVCLNSNPILSSNIDTIRTITSIALVCMFLTFAASKFFSILSKNDSGTVATFNSDGTVDVSDYEVVNGFKTVHRKRYK